MGLGGARRAVVGGYSPGVWRRRGRRANRGRGGGRRVANQTSAPTLGRGPRQSTGGSGEHQGGRWGVPYQTRFSDTGADVRFTGISSGAEIVEAKLEALG